MALGVAANTIGKVIASTVFMSCLVHVSISDFLLFVKNGFVVGARTLNVTAGHCKNAVGSYEYPKVARRLALDNRTYPAQLANTTHTRCRPTLSWMGARWPSGFERREVGEGGREGGREAGRQAGREGGREGRRGGWEGGREGGREGRRERWIT